MVKSWLAGWLPPATRCDENVDTVKGSRTHLCSKAHGHPLVLPFCIVPQKTEGPQGKMTCPELMAGPRRPIPTPVPLPAYPTVLGKTQHTHSSEKAVGPPNENCPWQSSPERLCTYPQEVSCLSRLWNSWRPGFLLHTPGSEALGHVTHTYLAIL